MTRNIKNAIGYIDLKKRMAEQPDNPPAITPQESHYIITQIRLLGTGGNQNVFNRS